jgi:MFS family permease
MVAIERAAVLRIGVGAGTGAHRCLALILASNVCASASWAIFSPAMVANCLERGTSTFVIGILASIWALPFLVAAPLYARIVARFNAKNCLMLGMAADVISLWLFPLFPSDWSWLVLQVLSGATLGHFSLITEAWLNLFSTENTRGRVLSLYTILPVIGYGIGTAIYVLVGYHGYAPFVWSSIAMAAGFIPIVFIPREAADVVVGGEERLRHVFRQTPLLLVIAFCAAVLEMVPWSLLQVYAIDNRWSTRAAALALPVFYWGQLVLAYPVGQIADRIPRRGVLLGLSAMALLCMAGLALLARTNALWIIIFLMGGLAAGIYASGLAILGQRFEPRTLVSANAGFLACYAVGTVIAPPVAGALMDRLGPTALPIALACTSACVFGCALVARVEWQRPSGRALPM